MPVESRNTSVSEEQTHPEQAHAGGQGPVPTANGARSKLTADASLLYPGCKAAASQLPD